VERSFSVRCERHDDVWVVVARGEIDMASAPEVARALDADAGAALVVLDLRAVTFLDSSALGLIVAQLRRARERGSRFAVAAGPGSEARRLLELAGLLDAVEVVEAPDGVLDEDAA
jgi:anti-sigma B factor antagonist